MNAWGPTWAMVGRRPVDILAPGHGPLGTRDDVAAFRGSMEDLRAEVLAHLRAGRTLEEPQQAVALDAYKDCGQYEQWPPLNIAGMYQRLALNRRGN